MTMNIKLITPPTIEPVTVDELKYHLRIDSDIIDEITYLENLITTARLDVENDTSRKIIIQTWDYFPQGWPSSDRIKLPFGNLQSITSINWKDADGAETNMTRAITAFAASDISPTAKTKVTSAIHGFSDEDVVFISGTTSYNGAWEISNVTTNTFDIITAFVANDATGMASTDYIVEANDDQCGFIVLPDGGTWPSDTLYPSNPITIRFACGYSAVASSVPEIIKQAIKVKCAALYTHRGDNFIGQTVTEDKTYNRLTNNIPRLYDREFI